MKTYLQLSAIVLLGILNATSAAAQQDSVLLKNDKYLIGEIKSMDKAVLVMKTAYSKENFRIKFPDVEGLFSETFFLISTKTGNRLYGKISSPEKGLISVRQNGEPDLIFPKEDIVHIKPIEESFLSRLNGGIDLGYTLTRAGNQRQFTVRSRIGYLTRRWQFDASLNMLSAVRDDIQDINRGDANLTSIYSVRNEWLLLARADYLYNTQQLIDLRNNMKLGLGRYLQRTNRMTWTVLGGLSYNIENFSGDIEGRNSREAWFGSELNLFDFGDLSLLTNIFVYPSLSESDRIRVDYRIDVAYDLPLDFYIKTGFTLNYDNRPAGNSSESDYILQTTFGWSW